MKTIFSTCLAILIGSHLSSVLAADAEDDLAGISLDSLGITFGAEGVLPYRSRVPRTLNLSTWNWDSWSVKTNTIPPKGFQSRIALGNGYHGVSLSSVGPFYEEDDTIFPDDPDSQQGWPLMTARRTFATVAGFYDSQERTPRTNYDWLLQYGGESVISGIPHWTTLSFCVDIITCFGTHVNRDEITAFSDEMDFKTGIKTTTATWAPKRANGVTFDIKYIFLVHKSRINLGMTRLEITASDKFQGFVSDVLDERSAKRTAITTKAECQSRGNALVSTVHPIGLPDVSATVYSTLTGVKSVSCDMGINKSLKIMGSASSKSTVDLKKGRKVAFQKYVGVASSDGYADPAEVAKSTSIAAKKAGWDKLVTEHTKEWQKLINPARVPMYYEPKKQSKPATEDLELLQIGSIVSTFYLASALGNADSQPGLNDNSAMVGGFGSDAYAGWIFWDSDLFMAPGLLLSHPRQVQTIGEYRVKTSGQARANAQFNPHQALHPKTDSKVYQDLSNESIIYPWISGRFGNCTAAGPCRDYQYHVNTAVAMNLYQTYITTGNEAWLKDRAWPVIKGIAHMYSEKVYYNQTMKGYGLLNMSDPDEYTNFINDGAYTLASISRVLEIASQLGDKIEGEAPAKWSEISKNVALPHNAESNITPEFNGMNGSITIKQFDVPGTTYPLEFRLNAELEKNNLRYYAKAQSPDGPAMTYSFLSVASAAVSPGTCESFSLALQSLKPYLRSPWFQYSEQQIDDARINGGTHPAFPFLTGHGGFLHIAPMAWAGFRFHADSVVLKPRIPPQIEYLRLPQFHWKGTTLELTITQKDFTLTRLKTKDDWVKDAQPKQPIPVTILQNPCGTDLTTTFHPNETHILKPGGKLTLPIPALCDDDVEALAGARNVLHCAPVRSYVPTYPGRYAHGAVDGGTGTFWQPLAPELQISMDVRRAACAKQGSINWGERPPVSFRVFARNISKKAGADSEWKSIFADTHTQISQPFNEKSANRVRLPSGNSSKISSFCLAEPCEEGQRICADEWRLAMQGSRYYAPEPSKGILGHLQNLLGYGPEKDLTRIGATVVKFELWDDDEVVVDPVDEPPIETVDEPETVREPSRGVIREYLDEDPDEVEDMPSTPEDEEDTNKETWRGRDDL